MELRQLDLFRILAQELSFTRTAKRANCVQSNVTVQIRSIETELGIPLFERLGRHVQLTPHGERLLPYAEKVLSLIDEASAIARGNSSPTGTLTIGSPESVLTYRLLPIVQVFRNQFPNVNLIFRSSGSSDLPTQLEHGQLDFGLVIDEDLHHSSLDTKRLCAESLILLASPSHALGKQSVRPQDLQEHSFLLTDLGCAYRSKLERTLATASIVPNAIMEFSSVETIKQCAALGMGIACLPAIVAQKEIADGKLIELAWKGPQLSMQTLAVWHKNKWISPAMLAFFDLLHLHLGKAHRRPPTIRP